MVKKHEAFFLNTYCDRATTTRQWDFAWEKVNLSKPSHAAARLKRTGEDSGAASMRQVKEKSERKEALFCPFFKECYRKSRVRKMSLDICMQSVKRYTGFTCKLRKHSRYKEIFCFVKSDTQTHSNESSYFVILFQAWKKNIPYFLHFREDDDLLKDFCWITATAIYYKWDEKVR